MFQVITKTPREYKYGNFFSGVSDKFGCPSHSFPATAVCVCVWVQRTKH